MDDSMEQVQGTPIQPARQLISAVVIAYNRADLIQTCLKALTFADEIIVIDKSSTDGTASLAAALADRVISVPWSPVVEDTRRFALDQCAHEWVICLDDDECLSVEAANFIIKELEHPRADVYFLPQRHYILGVHDENAYYWPEYQPRFFRRSAVEFSQTVHGSIETGSNKIYRIPFENGICIHHLSHKNVMQWIEKTNRYTSRLDRVRIDDIGYDLAAFAHANLDHWLAKTKSSDRGSYPTAVAILRSLYDIIDRLKIWESEAALDGDALFQAVCKRLESDYRRALPARASTGQAAQIEHATGPAKLDPPQPQTNTSNAEARDRSIELLQDALRKLRVAATSAQDRANDALSRERQEFDRNRSAFQEQLRAAAELAQQRADEASMREQALTLEHSRQLTALYHSTSWRVTAPLRVIARRTPPRVTRNLRRLAKLLWWTVTLKLPSRYAAWRANRLPGQAYQQTWLERLTPTRTLHAADITVPMADNPAISVIIATYGQLQLTLACLKSIAEHPPARPIEVIVVDDAYPGPDSMASLAEISGITLIRNTTNLGFLLSCNHAATQARGDYIYLLNNDTEVMPGAIDALADLLEHRPDAGLAGSKLLFPDRRLQEAGGIMWDDASGWNYGRGQDPARPEYNYVREADYVSGASIMLRRDLFESLGGFDPAFAPAYYEDTDLAFRIRARGLKVLFEPRSVVIHHEGASHGTDITQGVKAHQITNKALMQERWGPVLARENYPNGQHILRARDRARHRKVILVIDHYTPEPDRDAGSRSILGIMDSLLDAGWVVKFWPQNRAYSPSYTMALEARGIEVLDHRYPGDLTVWLRENGAALDHLLVVRPTMAMEVLPHIIANHTAMLSFYGVDLHFARMERQADLDNNLALREAAAQMKQLERRVWQHFDLVIYPSEDEAQTVCQIAPRTLARGIVPFWFEIGPARLTPPPGHVILFVAGFAHPPNVDAALFLIREILPRLKQAAGPVRIILAGSNPTETVRALAGPDVEVTGYVTDEALAQLYQRARAAIVPLRFGAGVKGKVVESLSHGLPLVTTSIGVQGIPGLAEILPVHDDAPGLATALALLLTDDTAWRAQSAKQTAFAQAHFSRSAMRASVLAAFDAGSAAIGLAP